MSGEWQYVVGPGASTSAPKEARQLTTADARTTTWRTRGHAVAQFSIDARSDEADEIAELETDLWERRDGELLFRGRCATMVDDITPDEHRLQVTAVDYRGMLAHRTTWTDTPSYASTEQAAIAWQIIQATQARTGGNWGITQGLSPTGQLRDRSYPAMKRLLDLLNELGDVENGFEWEISPTLELNVWSPTRGTTKGVFDLNGKVSAITGVLNPSTFGNAVGVTGAESTAPTTAEAAGLATDARGRWERIESFPTITQQTTLNARPARMLADAQTLASPLTLTLTPGGWEGKDDVWLGDTITAQINSGRFGSLAMRVMEVQVTHGDRGTETVRLGTVPT